MDINVNPTEAGTHLNVLILMDINVSRFEDAGHGLIDEVALAGDGIVGPTLAYQTTLSEVDQQTEGLVGKAEIVAELAAVVGGEMGHRLHLYDDISCHEVGAIGFLQRMLLVVTLYVYLALMGDTAVQEFVVHGFLVDGFEESSPQLAVYFHGGTNEVVHLILVSFHIHILLR